MANNPYADLTADLTPASASNPYADLTADLPATKPPVGMMNAFGAASELAPWNALRDKLSQGTAETIGKKFPVTGALAGTAVDVLPQAVAMFGGGLGNLQESENPIAQGLTNTPKELSPQYDELLQNPDLNISGRTPELGGAKATFPNPYANPLSTKPPLAIQTDTSYPTNLRGAEPLPSTVPLKYPGQADNPRAFINFANARIQAFGNQLSPQEVTDYGKIISQYYKDGVFPKGSPLASDGAKLSASVDNLQNTLVPGRGDLDTAYRISKVQSAITNFLLKAPLYLGEGATGIYGIKKGYQWLTGP